MGVAHVSQASHRSSVLTALAHACGHAGTLDTNWFTLNRALNGGSVWQNDCKSAVHRNNRYDNNTAERGSAGVEMNQIGSIDIASCTFNTGKGAKGSGLYLQVGRPLAAAALPSCFLRPLHRTSWKAGKCARCTLQVAEHACRSQQDARALQAAWALSCCARALQAS